MRERVFSISCFFSFFSMASIHCHRHRHRDDIDRITLNDRGYHVSTYQASCKLRLVVSVGRVVVYTDPWADHGAEHGASCGGCESRQIRHGSDDPSARYLNVYVGDHWTLVRYHIKQVTD